MRSIGLLYRALSTALRQVVRGQGMRATLRHHALVSDITMRRPIRARAQLSLRLPRTSTGQSQRCAPAKSGTGRLRARAIVQARASCATAEVRIVAFPMARSDRACTPWRAGRTHQARRGGRGRRPGSPPAPPRPAIRAVGRSTGTPAVDEQVRRANAHAAHAAQRTRIPPCEMPQ